MFSTKKLKKLGPTHWPNAIFFFFFFQLSSFSTSHPSFTHSLPVGTPQNVSMVIDIGSELSWLHCNKTPNFPTTFDPVWSTSYSLISCSSPTCTTQTQDFPIPTSCDKTLMNPAIVSKSRTCALPIPVSQSAVDPLSPSVPPIPVVPHAHCHFLFLLLLFSFVWILDFLFLIFDFWFLIFYYGFWISLRDYGFWC